MELGVAGGSIRQEFLGSHLLSRQIVEIKAHPIRPARVESEPMSPQALKALERRMA